MVAGGCAIGYRTDMAVRFPGGAGRLLSVSMFLLAVLPAQRGKASPAPEPRTISQLVADSEALGVRTGVLVQDLGGDVLFRHRADETFLPASNQKLLSAAAVLAGLGPDHLFKTPFRLRGGRLVVTASGDPNWIQGGPDDPQLVFGTVVAALQRLRVERIRGIDLEPGTFTGPSRPATWPKDQLDTYYCAPTGPFVLEQGTFVLDVRPGGGAAAVNLLAPLVDLPFTGSIALVPNKNGAIYGAIDLGTSIKLSGKLYAKAAPARIRTAVRDPAAWYAAALQRALRDGGITVAPDAPAVDAELYEHQSELRTALLRMLQDSSNFDAEQCLRVLGAVRANDGSLAGGIQAAQDLLRELLGTLPQGFVMADGSGLSRGNQVSPSCIIALLSRALVGRSGTVLLGCLPVGGESGTLEGRFRGSAIASRVRAKTGWIRGCSSLSGVLVRADGGYRLFSILMNYDPKRDGLNKQLKELQEAMVEACDRLRGRP